MSTFRFDLPEHHDMEKVYHWMNQHVGPQKEGVTWFWSTRIVCYKTDQGVSLQGHRNGIEIWRQGPSRFLAALAWSA